MFLFIGLCIDILNHSSLKSILPATAGKGIGYIQQDHAGRNYTRVEGLEVTKLVLHLVVCQAVSVNNVS